MGQEDRFCAQCGTASAYPPVAAEPNPAQQYPAQQYQAQQFQVQPHSSQPYPVQIPPAESYPPPQYPAESYPPPQYPAQPYSGEQFPPPQSPAQSYPPPYSQQQYQPDHYGAPPPQQYSPPPVPPDAPANPAAPPAVAWDDHVPRPGSSPSVEYSGSSFSSATTVPWSVPFPPPQGMIASVPGVSSAASTPAPSWQIDLDTGQTITVDEPVVLGRNPTAEPGCRAVPVQDETRSVSKTHLMLQAQDGQMLVTDLHSTNGVAIVVGHAITTCLPGEATVVPDGATVRFGERELRVRALS